MTEQVAPAAWTLGEILERGALRSVFQPIVDLDTGRLFGFEALSRGPEGSALERPDRLFDAARTQGRLAEVDAACQAKAVANAHAIKSPLTLFMNVEPDATGFGPLADLPLPIYSSAPPYTWRTPFELASAHRPVRHGTIPLLAAISRDLERQAASSRRTSLLISSFPGVDRWMSQMDEVYGELAAELAFTAVLAVGMPPEPVPGLHGINIYEDDPVSGTWNVIVISAHFAAMLAAKERPRTDGAEQEFDFIFTYDRALIVECAQALMLRIASRAID